jgi:putative FmdB family regulatory protein
MQCKLVELQCIDCEHPYEYLWTFKEEDKPICPKCGNSSYKVIIGNPMHHKHVSHSQWRVGHAD